MVRRDSPLEPWEWTAILARLDVFEPTIQALLPGLLRAQALTRHCESVRRRQRAVARPWQRASVLPGRQTPTARLEHRLYTLFAE